MTTTAVEAETKTMNALALILRAEGIHVVQVLEEWRGDNDKNPKITFDASSDKEALAVADLAVRHGYPLLSLVHRWLYVDGQPLASGTSWVMEFCRSGSKPLSLYSS